MQKYLQNFQKLHFYLSKTEIVQILSKGICVKIVQSPIATGGRLKDQCNVHWRNLLGVEDLATM